VVEVKRVERVILACVQCRSRHIKCDATQPICNRCKSSGKECSYQKSRRGGLDKAALARRRLRLQEEADRTRNDQRQDEQPSGPQDIQRPFQHSFSDDQLLPDRPFIHSGATTVETFGMHTSHPSPVVAFQVEADRLYELYFENFWPSFPVVLPLPKLLQRRTSNDHGLNELLLVLQWIGSIYAPWTPSEPYYGPAHEALGSPFLTHTPFVVQALMLFAIAQHHSDLRQDSYNTLNFAVSMALELNMNQKSFAQAYGESNPVLEESWRRTYYMLYVSDQYFAIVSSSPIYILATVPNNVDLPCDDEYYQSGQIPPVLGWNDYCSRELADLEVVFSSL
jgi:hypothetical protein